MNIYKMEKMKGSYDKYEPIEIMMEQDRYFISGENAHKAFLDAIPEFLRKTHLLPEEYVREVLALIAGGPGEYSYEGIKISYSWAPAEADRLYLQEDSEWAEMKVSVYQTEDEM